MMCHLMNILGHFCQFDPKFENKDHSNISSKYRSNTWLSLSLIAKSIELPAPALLAMNFLFEKVAILLSPPNIIYNINRNHRVWNNYWLRCAARFICKYFSYTSAVCEPSALWECNWFYRQLPFKLDICYILTKFQLFSFLFISIAHSYISASLHLEWNHLFTDWYGLPVGLPPFSWINNFTCICVSQRNLHRTNLIRRPISCFELFKWKIINWIQNFVWNRRVC